MIRLEPDWGRRYGAGEQPDYRTPDGTLTDVWMYRKGQRVRFYDRRALQVGPEHANMAPAVVWAALNGWIDPSHPDLSVASILEVRGSKKCALSDGRGTRPVR